MNEPSKSRKRDARKPVSRLVVLGGLAFVAVASVMVVLLPVAEVSPHKSAIAATRHAARQLVAWGEKERVTNASCRRTIERAREIKDAWGTAFAVDCVDRANVRSAGPDTTFETEDDMAW